jgi:hypothetical protein
MVALGALIVVLADVARRAKADSIENSTARPDAQDTGPFVIPLNHITVPRDSDHDAANTTAHYKRLSKGEVQQQ